MSADDVRHALRVLARHGFEGYIQVYDDKTVATEPEVYVADDILHVTWTKP